MSDKEESLRLRMLLVLICVVLASVLTIMVYATFRRATEASLPMMFKHGILRCESKRVVAARLEDRVAILLPEDTHLLQSHFGAQGMSVPHHAYVLMMEEHEQREPVFVFIKSEDEIDSACITGILEVVKLNPFYAQLMKKYFQLAPIQSESGEYVPITAQD